MYDNTKSFNIKKGIHLASAELSKMENKDVAMYLKSIKDTAEVWYFNRLIVPPIMRKKGVANKLLQQVAEWADIEEVTILNTVSPYGDLNMKQLIKLYSKFGFEQPDKKLPLLIRYAKRRL